MVNTIHTCTVCLILDNDNSLKPCSYCKICKSWICKKDLLRLDRRALAMMKKSL